MLLYALAISLSAFLLFEVQPIIAKTILPWFGGTSAVWSTCMLFFQVVLLLGYLYAHWLHRTFGSAPAHCWHPISPVRSSHRDPRRSHLRSGRAGIAPAERAPSDAWCWNQARRSCIAVSSTGQSRPARARVFQLARRRYDGRPGPAPGAVSGRPPHTRQ